MRRIHWLVFVTVVVALYVTGTVAADHTFVGVDKCKLCHKLQFDSWSKTKHATAWAALKPEEQAKAECAGCHSTNGAALPNVQCEACHAAGSDYKVMAVMKDKEKAIAAGLNIPDEAYCTTKCHNNKSPQFKGFDFKTAVTKVHEHKAPAAGK